MRRSQYAMFVLVLSLLIAWAVHTAAQAGSSVSTTRMVSPSGATVTVNTSDIDAYLALGYAYYPASGDFTAYYPRTPSKVKAVLWTVGDHASATLSDVTVPLYGTVERVTIDANGTDTEFTVALRDQHGALLWEKDDVNSLQCPLTYAVSLAGVDGNRVPGAMIGGAVTLAVSDLALVAEVQTATPSANATRGPWSISWNGMTTASVDEVVTISDVNSPDGGTFKLSFGGQQTGAIDYNATAATIEAALIALSSIEVNEVSCSGGPLPDANVVVTFVGGLGGQNVGAVTLSNNSLTSGEVGETASYAITVTQAGSGLVYNSDAAAVTAALAAVTGIEPGDITAGGSALSAGAMTFTFRTTFGDVPPIVVDVSRLTGPESVAVAETVKGHSALDRIAVTMYYRTDPE